jgi:MFS family permease
MGWSNSLLGRFGFVLSPLLVSTLSEQQGWSSVMPYLAVLPMLTLLIVWRFVPRADKLPVRGSSDDSARPVSAEPTAPAGQAAMAEPEAD